VSNICECAWRADYHSAANRDESENRSQPRRIIHTAIYSTVFAAAALGAAPALGLATVFGGHPEERLS
jgi:hypothetical protein